MIVKDFSRSLFPTSFEGVVPKGDLIGSKHYGEVEWGGEEQSLSVLDDYCMTLH